MTTTMDDKLGTFFPYAIPSIAIGIVLATAGYTYRCGHTLLAMYFTCWFILSYIIATQDFFLSNPNSWNYQAGDITGALMFGMWPLVPLPIFYGLYKKNIKGIKEFVLHKLPPQYLIGLQTYRIAGACFSYMYMNGTMSNYCGLQTGILDIFIGLTSLPLAGCTALLLGKQRKKITDGQKRNINQLRSQLRRVVYVWNIIGLYDLLSAYAMFAANFLGLYDTGEYALSVFAFYPISLVALFQVPLAIGIHILFLTSMDDMMVGEDAGKEE